MTTAPEQPTLSAILPYFGGKRSMAGEIIEHCIGRHTPSLYVEPFHGSCAMLIELRRLGRICPAIVNDKYRLVSILARVIATPELCGQLIKLMMTTAAHEDAYQQARTTLAAWAEQNSAVGSMDDDPIFEWDVQVAYAYLVYGWLGRSGQGIGTKADLIESLSGFAVRWGTGGGDPATRFQSVAESLPAWHRYLHNKTTFTCRDAIDVLDSVDDASGVWIYCDPPYLHETLGGSHRYAVDDGDATGTFHEHTDLHARLAESLSRFEEATVAVSYYQHERLARLYPEDEGWLHEDMTRDKASSHASGSQAESPEVVIVRCGS